MNEELEEFRKALMKEAYESFLSWAWGKQEIRDEFVAYQTEMIAQDVYAEMDKSFDEWVTEMYWGELE